MTKREMFVAIREVVVDNAEMVAFIDHEIELLNRKSSGNRKPTKTQLENEVFKADIVTTLENIGRPATIAEIMTECESIANLTNQKISALLTALRKDGQVIRTYEKKVAHFELGAEGE